MERGCLYQLKQGVSFPGGFFSYGRKRGMYVGETREGWPRFYLGKGREMSINCGDPEQFLEKVPYEETRESI